MAIASSAIEMRSPAVKSMSSSRPGGSGDTSSARSISSSVVSPMADTTTHTSCPDFLAATMRVATRLMLVASATLEPPYFCTTSATTDSFPGPTRGTGADSLATAIAGPNGRGNKVGLSASYGGTVMTRVGTALALAAVLTLTSCTSGD